MKLYVIVWARVPLTLIHWAAAGAFSTPQDVTTSWLRCTPPCIRHSCPFLPHPVVWTFVPFVILLAQTIVPVSNSHIVAATINMGKYLAAPQKFITTYKIVALTKTPDNRYFEFDREESDKTTCKHSRSVLRRRPSAQFQLLYKFIWHVMHVIKRSYTARYFFFGHIFLVSRFIFSLNGAPPSFRPSEPIFRWIINRPVVKAELLVLLFYFYSNQYTPKEPTFQSHSAEQLVVACLG